MQISFLPPKEVIKKISAHSKQELMVYVCAGAGIIRWALNDRFVMPSGVKWVYSIFNIQEMSPHPFFKYSIDGKFTILEQDRERFKPVIPGMALSDIKKAMIWLKENEGIADMCSELLTQEKLNILLLQFSEYIYDDNIVFNNKRVTDIYTAIPKIENTQEGILIRVPNNTCLEYKQLSELQVKPEYTIRCEECNEVVPCCDSTQNPLCRNCRNEIYYDDRISCKHAECCLFGCMHYKGSINFQESDVPDYFDELLDRRR